MQRECIPISENQNWKVLKTQQHIYKRTNPWLLTFETIWQHILYSHMEHTILAVDIFFVLLWGDDPGETNSFLDKVVELGRKNDYNWMPTWYFKNRQFHLAKSSLSPGSNSEQLVGGRQAEDDMQVGFHACHEKLHWVRQEIREFLFDSRH